MAWDSNSVRCPWRFGSTEIFEGYPDLRPYQRRNIEQQLQECSHALSPKIKEIAPPQIITANASMSAAFAMF